MRHKRYLQCKKTEVQWIGNIPHNWNYKRLKYVCPISDSKFSSKPENARYLAMENIESWTGKLIEEADIEDVDSAVNVFNPGDILFGKLRPYLAKVFRPDFDGVCSTELVVMKPTEFLCGKYPFYFLLSHGFIMTINALAYGVRMPRASPEQIQNMIFVLPPKNEQIEIYQYLDREISYADDLIKKYDRFLMLIQEQRLALITRAVTKGLNPKAQIKDSGVDWIGEIPDHWKVKKIKHVSTVMISNVDKKSNPEEPDVLLCNYIDVYKNEFITSNMEFMKATANQGQINKLSLKKGDVLITKDSETPDDIAVPSLVKDELDGVVCGYHLAILRPYKNVLDGEYLLRTLQAKSINTQFVVEANGVTRFGISTYPIENSIVLIPPISEQNDIALYINVKTEIISKTIDNIQRQIDLLNEYKASLISHAVTGKIDVRGYA
jgi:type I restriction enzyme S subunit